MSDFLQNEVTRVQARILYLLRRVPEAVNSGSYDSSVRYKKTAILARKRAEMKSPKFADLQQSCNELEQFERPVIQTTESATCPQ